MLFEGLEDKIKLRRWKAKLSTKILTTWIKSKSVRKNISRTPEPHILSNPKAPLKLVTPNPNQPFKSSLQEMELKFCLGTVFHKAKRRYK